MKKVSQLTCRNCANDFTAKRSDAIFCSKACKQDNYEKRKSGKYIQPRLIKEDPAKAIVYLLLWLSEFSILIGHGTVLKIDLEELLKKIQFQNSLFYDLPVQGQIRDHIETLCKMLLNKVNELRTTAVDSTLIRSNFSNQFEKLLAQTKSAVTLVFTIPNIKVAL